MADSYDVGDVIVALRVLSIFMPDGVAVRFDGQDVVLMDYRGIVNKSWRAEIHDAAEQIFEGL